jgi:surface protein
MQASRMRMRRACRHTDATLRVAVALWFDDIAAAVVRYGRIGDWDTRDVKSMRELFKGRADFDDDISRWNVSGVEDMENMFYGATSFNQPLNTWDVRNVKSMYQMFEGAASFNQPLDKWDVSRVENKRRMLDYAASFKQPATLKRFGLSGERDHIRHCAAAGMC